MIRSKTYCYCRIATSALGCCRRIPPSCCSWAVLQGDTPTTRLTRNVIVSRRQLRQKEAHGEPMPNQIVMDQSALLQENEMSPFTKSAITGPVNCTWVRWNETLNSIEKSIPGFFGQTIFRIILTIEAPEIASEIVNKGKAYDRSEIPHNWKIIIPRVQVYMGGHCALWQA